MHDAVDCLDRLLERQTDGRLRRKVINVGRLDAAKYSYDTSEIAEDNGMKADVIVNTEVMKVRAGRSLLVARGAMNFETSADEQLRQISSVLPGHPKNDRDAPPRLHVYLAFR
jgi:hypothetical protein